jgi:hypothetical protein
MFGIQFVDPAPLPTAGEAFMRALPVFILFVAMPEVAAAHWGHVGELAGHGHLIAVGAGLTAAVIAALLGKKKLEEQSRECEVEEEGEPEQAGA